MSRTCSTAAPKRCPWPSPSQLVALGQAKKERGHWCGSWRVSSTISYIECAWFLATNNLLPSSEQQLVNCDTVDSGCNGELMDNASASAKKNVMWTETGHSYIAKKGTCMASSCTAWEVSSW